MGLGITGFRRQDGSVGFRNHVLILPTVVCANRTVSQIAEAVSGTVSIYNDSGCGLLGSDKDVYVDCMVGIATNPNVAGVLVVGLGCEPVSAAEMADLIRARGQRVEQLEIQGSGGTFGSLERGCRLAQELVGYASRVQREVVDLSGLMLGVECGGSDPASGISANPALGVAVDMLVDAGATVIMSETDEMIGAEAVLEARAADPDIGRRIREMIRRFEQRIISYGVNLSEGQPVRGNVEAGLTTIEEKSLGCITKLGSRPIREVLEYGQRPSCRGAVLMDSPGFDPYSVTGLVAAGAQVIAFTTGKGTPCGTAVAPTIKITSNTPGFRRMPENADIDAGSILHGRETVEAVGRRIYEFILDVLNGRPTAAELQRNHLFGIWRKLTSL